MQIPKKIIDCYVRKNIEEFTGERKKSSNQVRERKIRQ